MKALLQSASKVCIRAWTNVRTLENSRTMIEIRTRIFTLPKFGWFANFVLISNKVHWIRWLTKTTWTCLSNHISWLNFRVRIVFTSEHMLVHTKHRAPGKYFHKSVTIKKRKLRMKVWNYLFYSKLHWSNYKIKHKMQIFLQNDKKNETLTL